MMMMFLQYRIKLKIKISKGFFKKTITKLDSDNKFSKISNLLIKTKMRSNMFIFVFLFLIFSNSSSLKLIKNIFSIQKRNLCMLSDSAPKYCEDVTRAIRRPTRTINVNHVLIGSNHPVAKQTMTTTNTKDVEASVEQVSSTSSLS